MPTRWMLVITAIAAVFLGAWTAETRTVAGGACVPVEQIQVQDDASRAPFLRPPPVRLAGGGAFPGARPVSGGSIPSWEAGPVPRAFAAASVPACASGRTDLAPRFSVLRVIRC